MPGLTNFHTHTKYCDGSATVEEMVGEAVRRGFSALGFSGHGYTTFDTSYCMRPDSTRLYRQDVLKARERYGEELEIYCGIEQDLFSTIDGGFDYVIGSVHYLQVHGSYYSLDTDEVNTRELVRAHFHGDYYAFAAAYFAQAAQVAEQTQCDIIGHFDLCTKYNEGGRLFDETSSLYREAALTAVRQAARAGRPFEINTGAMYRGLRSVPYPAAFILEEVRRLGGSVILSSDSHTLDSLGFGFDKAIELAKNCGFTSVKRLTGDGFIDLPISAIDAGSHYCDYQYKAPGYR